jgi:preprotein translocase subunit SecB
MKKYLFSLLIFINILFASECGNKLFTFQNSADSNITVDSFLKALLIENCNINVVYDDKLTEQKAKKTLIGDIAIKNFICCY